LGPVRSGARCSLTPDSGHDQPGLRSERDERELSQPIVSVSLGVPATFLFGGEERTQKPTRLRLRHGDVVVWGGPSRLADHGIDALSVGRHPLTGEAHYNLTCRVTGLT